MLKLGESDESFCVEVQVNYNQGVKNFEEGIWHWFIIDGKRDTKSNISEAECLKLNTERYGLYWTWEKNLIGILGTCTQDNIIELNYVWKRYSQ